MLVAEIQSRMSSSNDEIYNSNGNIYAQEQLPDYLNSWGENEI